jgi:hypothetical protein
MINNIKSDYQLYNDYTYYFIIKYDFHIHNLSI